ncbi:MAG: [protein-PII] uridylyltransferase [Burkholderiaceae bacterium]|nr:[protein-PII] uridylyltransferase [Burkholderiaceae bacterium]
MADSGNTPAFGTLEALKESLREARANNAQRWTPRVHPLSTMRRLARDVDAVLMDLWRHLGIPGAALVAVGGYGRGALAPYSDVDLLILMPEGYSEEAIRPAAERLVTAFWDIGLDAGHSIRSVSECIAQAQDDLTIASALLESRWICGPRTLHRQLEKSWFEAIDVKDFAQGKLLEMQQRHGRHQDSPYSLEPNCKESPGGLRDLQVLRWVTRAFGLGHRWDDLARDGLITDREATELQRAQRLLHLIRGHLHLAAGRREDRLVFDLQTEVAQRLGISARGTRRASEVLMQRYYRAAKAILQISSMLLANFEPRLFPSEQLPTARQARQIDDDFDEVYGLLEVRDEGLFQSEPAAMLRAFLLMQQHPELRGMSARTLRSLWNHRDLIDAEFRRSPANRALFLSILQQPRGIVHGLRLMNNLGILGRMLPVFRKIVGQMQHDLFHVYTVDQHILQVIRNLRRLTMDEHAHEFPLCSRLMAEFQSPWILYVAALFHDIAKGRGGDHSALGKLEVRRFSRDYGLERETTALLAFLVEHHLTMSQVAQKQDLADPETIASFRKIVRTPQRLTALYLLTVADIRGTSPKAWSNWKARLLEELYHRTLALMAGPGVSSSKHPQASPQTAYQLKTNEAERLLRLHGKDPSAAHAFWKTLELQYFLRHEASEIEWHARLIAWRSQEPTPIVIARRSPDETGLQVVVYQRDEEDLFARICAYFDAQNISILDAKIHTTFDGYAMDTFVVEPQALGGHQREMATIIEASLSSTLADRNPLPAPIRGRQSRQSKYFPIPPRIDLQPDSRGLYYVLNVTAADRTGLLYSIAKTLSAHGVRLQTARIMTLGERAEDVFLIQGESLAEGKEQIALEADLLKAIAA